MALVLQLRRGRSVSFTAALRLRSCLVSRVSCVSCLVRLVSRVSRPSVLELEVGLNKTDVFKIFIKQMTYLKLNTADGIRIIT